MKDHGPFPVTIMPNNITTVKEANNNKAHQTKLSLFNMTLKSLLSKSFLDSDMG